MKAAANYKLKVNNSNSQLEAKLPLQPFSVREDMGVGARENRGAGQEMEQGRTEDERGKGRS